MDHRNLRTANATSTGHHSSVGAALTLGAMSASAIFLPRARLRKRNGYGHDRGFHVAVLKRLEALLDRALLASAQPEQAEGARCGM
jgi:hypothetical protein